MTGQNLPTRSIIFKFGRVLAQPTNKIKKPRTIENNPRASVNAIPTNRLPVCAGAADGLRMAASRKLAKMLPTPIAAPIAAKPIKIALAKILYSTLLTPNKSQRINQ